MLRLRGSAQDQHLWRSPPRRTPHRRDRSGHRPPCLPRVLLGPLAKSDRTCPEQGRHPCSRWQELGSKGAAAFVACALLCTPSLAQTPIDELPPKDPGFDNSPDDIDSQLRESEKDFKSVFPSGPLQPLQNEWRRITRVLRQAIGLDLAIDYTGLYQNADNALPGQQSDAGGGDLDFFGRWNLINRDSRWPGALVFSTETRHRYTEIPPSQLGSDIGSLWGTTGGFTTQSYALTQLYWEQGSYQEKLVYRAGKMDPGAIYDGGRYVSSNYAFLSPAFSDTLAMPVPDTGLGAAAAIYPLANTYILGGIHDANGERASLGKIDQDEYFTALELGVTPRSGKTGAGLYHVTFWNSDARNEANVASGRGVAFTLQQEMGPQGNVVPFARYSYADGRATSVRQALAVGLGLEEPFGEDNDLIGLAFAVGEPTDKALKDQYVVEAFYRIQLTPITHVTPDLQVIFHPAKNPNVDMLTVGTIRLRSLF